MLEKLFSRGASQSAVKRRWLSLCTVWPPHSQWPSEQISEPASMRLPILQLSCRLFFGKKSRHPGLSAPQQPRFGSLRLLGFPKAKITVEIEICECDGHTVHKLSQRRLTAYWLTPQESDCWYMRSKVSADYLTSYIKATRPVHEILKMAGYFPHRPRIIEREDSLLLLYSVILIKIPAVMDMSSCRFVDKVEYFGAIYIPWRWRQQACPKLWCLSTELHGATCLKTGTSAQSFYGIWPLMFPVPSPTAPHVFVVGQQTTLIR